MFKHAFKILSFIASVSAFSAESLDPNLYSPDCRCFIDDAYDFGARMPQGAYKGECQNNCFYRSIVVLPSTQPNVYRVANVRHKGHYYTTEIPADAIEEVIWQVVDAPNSLNIPAGHTEMRWRLKSPVMLHAQEPHLTLQEVEMPELIFSIEGAFPKGVDFNLLGGGLRGDYVIAYRLITLEDLMTITLNGDPMKDVTQDLIELTAEQKRKLLKTALDYSAASGQFQIYHSLQKNCSTEAFDHVLDVVLDYQDSVKSFDTIYPVWNVHALKSRKVWKQRLPRLSEEMNR